MSVVRDEQGLILPRKLANPCLTSPPVRDLHNQIKWNAKTGINVLDNKSELEKALDRHRRQKVEKEKKEEETSSLTPFQKMLADRARRLEQVVDGADKGEDLKDGRAASPSPDTRSVFEAGQLASKTSADLPQSSKLPSVNQTDKVKPDEVKSSEVSSRGLKQFSQKTAVAGTMWLAGAACNQNSISHNSSDVVGQLSRIGKSKSSWELSCASSPSCAGNQTRKGSLWSNNCRGENSDYSKENGKKKRNVTSNNSKEKPDDAITKMENESNIEYSNTSSQNLRLKSTQGTEQSLQGQRKVLPVTNSLQNGMLSHIKVLPVNSGQETRVQSHNKVGVVNSGQETRLESQSKVALVNSKAVFLRNSSLEKHATGPSVELEKINPNKVTLVNNGKSDSQQKNNNESSSKNASWESSKEGKNSSWEGNSSGESSKSSSPEPESEFLRVFAQLKGSKAVAAK